MDIVMAQTAAAVCASKDRVVTWALERFDATALFEFAPQGKLFPLIFFNNTRMLVCEFMCLVQSVYVCVNRSRGNMGTRAI